MPMRLGGLATGLDTDAIVAELMSAQSLKKNKIVKAKTKLEWKQTAWSDLNKKLVNFYNKTASKMRLEAAYKVKKASVSDTSKATVDAGVNAVNGNYKMEVKEIATSQYLTSGKTSITSTSQKLTDVDANLLGKEITVKGSGGKEAKLEITADTTVNDFLKTMRNAGLNASYDTTQKRFFISSQATGADNAFSITSTAVSSGEQAGRQGIYDAIGYSDMSGSSRTMVSEAMAALQSSGTSGDAFEAAVTKLAEAKFNDLESKAVAGATSYVSAKKFAEEYDAAYTEAQNDDSIKEQFYKKDEEGNITSEFLEGKDEEGYNAAVAAKAESIAASKVTEYLASDEGKNDVKAAALVNKDASEITADIDATGASAEAIEKATAKYYSGGVTGYTGRPESVTVESIAASDELRSAAEAYAGVEDRSSAVSGTALTKLGLRDISVEDGVTKVNGVAYDDSDADDVASLGDMALINAKDSRILLNGAELTSSNSTVSANGLSIKLVSKTKEGESVNFSVDNDVDAAYKNVKDALKEYNELMKEMKTLYNAASSKGYEPLTSEEKKAMSDDEVEEWEKKIKESLLRSDSTLSSIMSGMRNAMMTTVNVNGNKYALSSFGIMTSNDYTEGGLLHIYGDEDDAIYADQTDKLKKALTDNPEETISALTDIFEKLREKMNSQMSAIPNYSSTMTFYSDKKMESDLKNYATELSNWEDKLASMEDAYYKKFSAMETAMAKLQSQTSSLAGLLGTG